MFKDNDKKFNAPNTVITAKEVQYNPSRDELIAINKELLRQNEEMRRELREIEELSQPHQPRSNYHKLRNILAKYKGV